MRSLHPWPIFPLNLDPPVARSLGLQFILQGIADAFPVLRRLETSTPFQGTETEAKEEIAAIFKQLEKILLFSLENRFAQKSSVLDKLCFYCEILLQASHVVEHEILVILEEMRSDILNARSKLLARKKPHIPADRILLQLSQLYSSLFHKICRFFDALTPFFKEARYDENVLIYLIENKDRFNSYLGLQRIEGLLQSFFPAGHAQLRAAIYEGYTRRGFTTFLSSIEPLVDALEWETPCNSPMKL